MPVSIDYVQDTVNTGDPCYKIETNVGSYMHLVHDQEKDKLIISHVSSKQHGDFKRMMNAVTQKLEAYNIIFTMVINDNLKQALHGFEEDSMYWEKLGEEMTVLKGEWEA